MYENLNEKNTWVYNENGKYVKEIVLTCTMPYPGYGEDKTEIDSGPLIVTVTSKE